MSFTHLHLNFPFRVHEKSNFGVEIKLVGFAFETSDTQKSPVYTEKSPIHTQKSPVKTQKSPMYTQKSPIYPQKSPIYTQKSPIHTQKSPIYTRSSLYSQSALKLTRLIYI